jgi:hypothetical protein
MRRALGGKLKLEFVDGTFPVVTDHFDPSYRAWNRCNMLVHSWIMNWNPLLNPSCSWKMRWMFGMI